MSRQREILAEYSRSPHGGMSEPHLFNQSIHIYGFLQCSHEFSKHTIGYSALSMLYLLYTGRLLIIVHALLGHLLHPLLHAVPVLLTVLLLCCTFPAHLFTCLLLYCTFPSTYLFVTLQCFLIYFIQEYLNVTSFSRPYTGLCRLASRRILCSCSDIISSTLVQY